MSEPIEEFRIHVPEKLLVDLRERLSRTRFPDQIEGADWSYGTELAYLRGLCDYWRDRFSWRAQEERLNRFPQFRATIEGLGLHFLHVRSETENALPLLLLHGWPDSIFGFDKVIGPLTDPAAYGGDADDAFHIVCPSLPGYGFSDAPKRPGFDVRAMAEVMAKLMGRLGYTRYGAQGGDWGAVLCSHLGVLDAPHVCGIHLNMLAAGPPEGEEAMDGLSPKELETVGEVFRFQSEETGYQSIQGTKPQTLGYGLNDSPAGLAAWIVEKYRTWSDCGGELESRFTKDELLTNIMIYWVTGSITSSTRLYCESRRSGRFGPIRERVEVPTGCAIFPKEIYRAPRRWAERVYNITQWTEMPSGGHFAALEEPKLLVQDIRSFFRPLR